MLNMPIDFEGEESGAAVRRVTMQDVAARAGVHQTTVSIALRNHPSIPEATRLRIQQIAREIGYRKDPGLEAFNRYRLSRQGAQSGQTIAFLTDTEDEDAFFADPKLAAYFRGAAARAEALKLGLRRVPLRSAERALAGLGERLRAEGISSLIIASLAACQGLALRWSEWIAVGIDCFPLESQLDLLAPDYRRAARRGVAELHGLGYRRIGYIAGSETERSLGELCQIGYLIEARMRDLPILQRTRPAAAWDEARLADWILEDDLDAVLCLEESWLPQLKLASALAARPLALATLDRQSEGYGESGVDLKREQVGAAAVDSVAEKVKSGWLRVGLAYMRILGSSGAKRGSVKSCPVRILMRSSNSGISLSRSPAENRSNGA